MARDRRNRNPRYARSVERAQMRKQIRRGLFKVSGRREIEPRARRPALEHSAEIERRFLRRDVGCAKPKLYLGCVMRRQLSRRVRSGLRHGRRVDRRSQRRFDLFPRERSRTQQLGPPAKTGDDRRLKAVAAWPSVKDEVDPAVEVRCDMRGGRRAHGAGSVGGWGGERDAS